MELRVSRSPSLQDILQQPGAREAFEKVTANFGADRLASYLDWIARSYNRKSVPHPFWVTGIKLNPRADGKAQLKALRRLPARVRNLAEEVERLHYHPAFAHGAVSPPTQDGSPRSEIIKTACCQLPDVLIAYADALESRIRYLQRLWRGVREWGSNVWPLCELLDELHLLTGRRFYKEVAILVTATYRAADIPRSIEPAALEKLYKRCQPTKPEED